MNASKTFTDPKEAMTFGLKLRADGIEPQVRVNPATPAVTRQVPDSAAALAEITDFAAKGEQLGVKARAWAQASPWWEGCLVHAVACLELDLADGNDNRAASRAQAALFLKRLKAALSRAPLVEQVFTAAKPQTWELHWQQPEGPDTDDNDTFGASTGSNGWLCD
ncbi:hypothetical protein UFOVP783_102 [uncultured Caudovirales phage]|uniref:Uncharacterized protein n=1 Tax=uncultured Caudovirales phage TaxID=2100421 RepID=A0A6J5P5A4_9CAUD|nr:hypothetical protein UFOVP783_102 [uncultured Caudovirales phage]